MYQLKQDRDTEKETERQSERQTEVDRGRGLFVLFGSQHRGLYPHTLERAVFFLQSPLQTLMSPRSILMGAPEIMCNKILPYPLTG